MAPAVEEALAKLTLVRRDVRRQRSADSGSQLPPQAEWPAERVRETFLNYFRTKARAQCSRGAQPERSLNPSRAVPARRLVWSTRLCRAAAWCLWTTRRCCLRTAA